MARPFDLYFNSQTGRYSVRSEMVRERREVLPLKRQLNLLLSTTEGYSSEQAVLVHLRKEHFETASRGSRRYYAVQGGAFRSERGAEWLASKLNGNTVQLAGDPFFRVFTGLFTSYEEAEQQRRSLLREYSDSGQEFIINQVDIPQSTLPEPVLYQIQLGAFMDRARAEAVASRYGAESEQGEDELYRVLYSKPVPYHRMVEQLALLRRERDLTDLYVRVVPSNSMIEVERLFYLLEREEREDGHKIIEKLCEVTGHPGCLEFTGGLIENSRVVIPKAPETEEFIMALERERTRIEPFLRVVRGLEQIPLVPFLME